MHFFSRALSAKLEAKRVTSWNRFLFNSSHCELKTKYPLLTYCIWASVSGRSAKSGSHCSHPNRREKMPNVLLSIMRMFQHASAEVNPLKWLSLGVTPKIAQAEFSPKQDFGKSLIGRLTLTRSELIKIVPVSDCLSEDVLIPVRTRKISLWDFSEVFSGHRGHLCLLQSAQCISCVCIDYRRIHVLCYALYCTRQRNIFYDLLLQF